MKIAIILPSLANKGPILVARDTIEYILSNYKNVYIDVFYFDDGPSVDFICPTIKINFFIGFDFDNYDILHSHMLRPDAFLFYHRSRIKSPRITTLHVYMYLDLMFTYNKFVAYVFENLWLRIISKFNSIIVLSRDMKEYYQNQLNNSRFDIINNGRNIQDLYIDTEIVIKIKNKFNNKIILGVIALLTKRKGIEQLIYALELNKDLALLIIGDGPERKNLEQLAQELLVQDRVLFMGLQKDAHVYNKIIDIYVLPSRSEGLPMSLIEAAYYAKPSVCSNLNLFKEFFNDSEIVMFNLDDIESLDNSIKYAWKNKSTLSENIFKRYTSAYQAKIMGANYYELYNELTKMI
jgi:glycosyltransferase involved in cell wall biosynthesis